MNLSNSNKMLVAAVLACALAGGTKAMAQQVIFPQQQQAGVAQLVRSGSNYVLQNDLLKATFVREGATLKFGGSPELNLAPGSELFIVRTGDGSTTVKASDMTLVGEVREVNYAADAQKVKGAEKLAGKALEADFRHGDLRITWRAVLRDGSHYLRTELSITSQRDVKMFAITPMTYSVQVSDAASAPKVVGNTRGAILMSNKIFAGLETPTGINSVGQSVGGDNFTYNRWTPESFTWTPGKDTPQGILNLGFTAAQVVGTKGYLSFKTAGRQTLTFNYQSGTHRLNIVGVDVCTLDGKVVSHDYHVGFTGGEAANNSYTLNIPETGVYVVRYFMETKTETITASGNVSFSGRVSQPVVVFDLAPEAPAQARLTPVSAVKSARALSSPQINEGDELTDSWTPQSWRQASQVPLRINELGWYAPNVYSYEQAVTINSKGKLSVEFNHQRGNNRLNICGVDLLDPHGNEVVSDYHNGFTGNESEKNVYSFQVPYEGDFRLRYLVTNKNDALTSNGRINVTLANPDTVHLPAQLTTEITGLWSRNTTLKAGNTWNVGAVVGLVAKDQPRRSFLAYNERERAVPWRPMPIYVSWYELNINRNNDRNYSGNMHDYQCNDVVEQWKKNLYEPYGEYINSYVWDDGWDEYGPWTFNKNFPNGFSRVNELATAMGSGIGAWLGPVGGYGQSGDYRRAYWAYKGGMQLSNPRYYEAFTKAITDLCKNRGYDFRFFKFDGISDLFSATGPKNSPTGEEDAEGIISAELMVRRDIKPDIFFNTSVGTWASPFWFGITDAVWRQEKDYGEISTNNIDRERWITYRDHLVYRNFVQNSPICPINNLMTHGFILSRFGDVSKDMSYEAIVREMRCAFACGSSMVELYNDYDLMNTLHGGRLWGDLAECLRWQRENADVLPDAHWVGGNPWDGTKANVYGWASWNGKKATLALRNPANETQTFRTTLRKALEIPAYVTGTMIFDKSFATQLALSGLKEGEAIDIDAQLTLTLPSSTVYVFDGRNSDIPAVATTGVNITSQPFTIAAGEKKAIVWKVLPAEATNQSVTWKSSDEAVATVDNGIVKGLKEGSATITVTTANGATSTLVVNVVAAQVEEYAVAFPKTEEPKRNDRFLRSITISSDKELQVLTLNANRRPYQELLNQPVEVKPGMLLTLRPDWAGSWMHSYVYIDIDQNKQFDVEDADSPELVAYNYYAKQQKGATGRSAQLNENPGVGVVPAFNAPTKAGTYRVRFKIDWDNISPAGQVDAGNHILTNGGSITDFLIKVVGDPTGVTAPIDEEKPVLHDLYGRRIAQPDPNTLYIRNGEKTLR